MLTIKIDLQMKKLAYPSLDHLEMVDTPMTFEECGETGHIGVNCLMVHQDINFVGNSTLVFIRIKASIRDGISPIAPSITFSMAVRGRISIGMSPLSEIL
jgi:hypothetical protein